MHDILVSQFRSALRMLRNAVANCNDELWLDDTPDNRYWHLAYHAVFYADFYLSPSEADFRPRRLYSSGTNFLENRDRADPCSRAELLGVIDEVDESLDRRMAEVPFDRPSGFPWLPLSRLELHIYNLRHVQHHAGQLIDRLRNAGLNSGAWIGRSDAVGSPAVPAP